MLEPHFSRFQTWISIIKLFLILTECDLFLTLLISRYEQNTLIGALDSSMECCVYTLYLSSGGLELIFLYHLLRTSTTVKWCFVYNYLFWGACTISRTIHLRSRYFLRSASRLTMSLNYSILHEQDFVIVLLWVSAVNLRRMRRLEKYFRLYILNRMDIYSIHEWNLMAAQIDVLASFRGLVKCLIE
jgi:hypothetical protein